MENFVLCVFIFSLGILTVISFPYDGWRQPSLPYRRAVMLSGYYGEPDLRRSSYLPEGSMTAFASGDTIATNSYLGSDQYIPVEEESEVDIQESAEKVSNESDVPQVLPEESDSTDSALTEESTIKPKRVSKKKHPQRPAQDEEQEDEQTNDFWPFKAGGNKVPSYNAFFPIMFGGYPGSRTRSGEDGFGSGSATAIANSFSTGKGGVASSHATSFGDPYLSMLLRNRFFRNKNPTVKDE